MGASSNAGAHPLEPRQPHAQRTVDKQWLKPVAEVKAFKTLCRTAFACEADAHQALARFAHDVQTTFLHDSTASVTEGGSGRPGPGAQPDQIVYHIAGASRRDSRTARRVWTSTAVLSSRDERTGRGPVIRPGCARRHKAASPGGTRVPLFERPAVLASSLYLKKPERIMALLMVMTVCLLVYAALEYRIRTALKEHAATFPDQKGKRIQNPTARWVFHYFVGIHVLYIPGQGLMILNLTDEHQRLLQLLGKRYAWFYR